MKLFIARHAETEADAGQIIANRGLEYGLTPAGYAQARALAERFIDTDLAGIFCSPLRRAVETAAIVAEVNGVPVAVADGLREVDYGELDGRADAEAWHELGAAFRQWLEFGRLDYALPGGESAAQAQARFLSLVRSVGSSGGTETYLFISHGGVLRLGLPDLLPDLPAEKFASQFLEYAEYALLEVKEGKFTCVEWRGEKINQEEK